MIQSAGGLSRSIPGGVNVGSEQRLQPTKFSLFAFYRLSTMIRLDQLALLAAALVPAIFRIAQAGILYG